MVIEEELLGCLGEIGLGVDEALEVGYREAGREVEGEEFLVEFMVGCDDRYGDSRPGRMTKQSALEWDGGTSVV